MYMLHFFLACQYASELQLLLSKNKVKIFPVTNFIKVCIMYYKNIF